MKRAVVTVITGEDEFLYPPVIDFADAELMCFTDINIKSSYWKIHTLKGLTEEQLRKDWWKYLPQCDRVEFINSDDIITADKNGGLKIVKAPNLVEAGVIDEEYISEIRSVRAKSEIEKEIIPEGDAASNMGVSENAAFYPLKLTIGMLVGKSSPYFDNCIESIKRIMDAISDSELIVVDTGNEDGSIDKLKKLGLSRVTIIPFKWIYDFSAARNAAVRLAKGKWYMTIDDDEWFDNIDSLVDFFTSDAKLYEKYDCAMYTQRNYSDKDGKNYEDSGVVRLAKMKPDLKYKGTIHENFKFDTEEVDPYVINSYVHHYGYVHSSDIDSDLRMAKARRNLTLLLLEIEKNPGNRHMILQIIQELCFLDRYDLVYSYALRGLSLDRYKSGYELGVFLVMLIKSLMFIDAPEVWNYEKRYIKNAQLSFVESANISYLLTLMAYESNDAERCPDKVIEYSGYFEDAYLGYKRLPKNIQTAMSVTICENLCNSEEIYTDMLILRALAFEMKKDRRRVAETLKKVKLDNLGHYPMNYYSLMVRQGIATVEFLRRNVAAPGMWMLFVQALLQNSDFCVELLENVSTQELNAIIDEAGNDIEVSEHTLYERLFDEITILRMICEYIQERNYKAALDSIKLALNGKEELRKAACILLDKLKVLMIQ